LEDRRRLAVRRVLDGYSVGEVADFLEVDPASGRRWVAAFRIHGDGGLAARPVSGRPPKLTPGQEQEVLSWLDDSPTKHGFPTDLWTTQRLAQLVLRHWGIVLNAHYLSTAACARLHPAKAPTGAARSAPGRHCRLVASRLARVKRLARRHDAYLVLLDEAGLLLAPLFAPQLGAAWAPATTAAALPTAREGVGGSRLVAEPGARPLGLVLPTAPR